MEDERKSRCVWAFFGFPSSCPCVEAEVGVVRLEARLIVGAVVAVVGFNTA